MKTRRKSKSTAAGHDEENLDVSLNVTIPSDIDEEALTNLLPDTNIAALTSDAIVTIYRLLLSQTSTLDATERERDETRAELERKEVELDQALQDKESSAKDLETSVEVVYKELAQVKQERDGLGEYTPEVCVLSAQSFHVTVEAKTTLQTQIATLSSSQSTSSTEVETLRRRVDDTEREKRELVGVISRLKDESSQRDGMMKPFFSVLSDPYCRGNTHTSCEPQGSPPRASSSGSAGSGAAVHGNDNKGT
jgi:nucleoprotein TPR